MRLKKIDAIAIMICLTIFFIASWNSPAISKPQSFQENYIYAVKLMNLGKYESALVEFKNLLSKTENKDWAAALLYMIGQNYYKLDNLREARVYLDRVNKNYPNSKFIIFVKELLNDINSKIPPDEIISADASDTVAAAINTNQTLSKSAAGKIVINYSDNTIAKDNNKNQSEMSADELARIAKLEQYVKEGNDYFNNLNFEQALQSYKRAAELDNENSVVKFNIGVAYLKLGNFAESNAMIEEVYKRNPEDIEALRYVAFTYLKLNKPVLSLIYWKRLLRLSPSDEMAASYIKKIEKMEELQ